MLECLRMGALASVTSKSTDDSDIQSELWISCNLALCFYTYFCIPLPRLHCRHFHYTTILYPVPMHVSPHHTPHPKQFFETSCVSYNSTQFWHYLPTNSITFHRFRAQSPKTAPTSDGNHNTRLSPVLLTNWLWFSKILSLGSINLVEWITEPKTPVSSPDYRVVTKNIKGYESIARWRNAEDEAVSTGASICPHGGWGSTLHTWTCPGSLIWKLTRLCPLGFYGGFLTEV